MIGEAIEASHLLDVYIDMLITGLNNAGGLVGKMDQGLTYPQIVGRVVTYGPGSNIALIIGNLGGDAVNSTADSLLNQC